MWQDYGLFPIAKEQSNWMFPILSEGNLGADAINKFYSNDGSLGLVVKGGDS